MRGDSYDVALIKESKRSAWKVGMRCIALLFVRPCT